ncbi:hypothetical protein ULMS_11240 [Patiriisocius marinistellae]|uniref:Uncharacterized protein n=1 Tax=Patiriisocius marinistellae TaxID=2494560 RepID=A0A5J4FZK2_9FLAO|nr:hypothetical protein [Patiriisocius marinistellae]GEQ85616.1 hypothetical protein ULMS_11240 [Patiriisocius marinistellae]
MLNYKNFLFIFSLLCVLFTSCVRDTDFEQSKEITLRPVVELNLIYFDVNASQFYDSIANTPILTVRDTTALDFLDGEDISDAIKRAEFFFKFENEIPRDFQVDFDFISENDELTYSTQTTVNQGTSEQIETTIFEPIVEEEEIDQLTTANRVVVKVTIPSSSATLTGNLNLQSKVTYFLEID